MSDRSFPVDIDDSQTVGDLKKVIVKEKPATFANIEADLLELRKVGFIIDWSWIHENI